MTCHLPCKGKSYGILGTLNNGFRVSFEADISPVIYFSIKKCVRSSLKFLKGTLFQSRKVATTSKALRKNYLSLATECYRAFIGHQLIFSSVNSHLQMVLLNPEAFLNFQKISIIPQQIESIFPGEKDFLLKPM